MSGGPTTNKQSREKPDLQTIRNSQHDQGNHRQRSFTGSDNNDQVNKLVCSRVNYLNIKGQEQETYINAGGWEDLNGQSR